MDKNPKFSIIIPVYNVEKYLSFCMESIIHQTLKDIEIICVNDGSTDSSLSILEEYGKLDDRIKIIDKHNGGLSSARNAGLDEAEGEYILFVDSDDCLEKNACARLYVEILQENADVIVFGTSLFPWCISPERAGWFYDVLYVETKCYKENTIRALFQERASKPFVWNECYRREILEKHNLRFDESQLYGEDMLFLFMLFPRISKVVYLQDKLYQYRCGREGSLMDYAGRNAEYKLKMHMKIIEKVLSDWNENGYIDLEMDSLYSWCLEFIVFDLAEAPLPNSDKKEMAIQLKNIIDRYHLHFKKKERHFQYLEQQLNKLTK